jgi:uncharacterized sulfatase
MPHLIPGQHVEYMFQTPTTRVWKKRHDEGKLTPAQEHFWNEKPFEELYDLGNDRDEVNNLADSPAHQEIKAKLRRAQQKWAKSIRDVGFVPEGERFARAGGDSLYDFGHDDKRYPFDRIFAAAETATMRKPESLPDLVGLMKDTDSAVRYLGALGIAMQKASAVQTANAELHAALSDNSPYVRIVAAQALATYGADQERPQMLDLLMSLADCSKNDVFVSIAALTALDELGEKSRSVGSKIASLPRKPTLPDERYSPYIPRLLDDLNERFSGK